MAQVIRFTILSVGNICGIAEYTIKAARMRGLRRSGVTENVRLSCCLLTILREIALLRQPLTYTLCVGHMSIRYLGTQTFDSKRLGSDLAFRSSRYFRPGVVPLFHHTVKKPNENRVLNRLVSCQSRDDVGFGP
jgi:hypothetical protein